MNPLRPSYLKVLLNFAEGAEVDDIELILKHGSMRKAHKTGIRTRSSLYRTIKRVENRAARQGHIPGTAYDRPMPSGYHIKGVSELVDQKGNTKLRWVKSEQDKDDLLRQLEDTFSLVAERFEKQAKPVVKPRVSDKAKDMCVVIPMGDPHVGMYAWAKEAEADFDCSIAEELMISAVAHLVDISPDAEQCMIINLGDFFHSDTVENKTLHSGNVLDVDGRWAKVQEIGFWIMITCIDKALAKYPKVIVHNAIGNHDEHTSQALAAVLSAWYRNEPRVEITREYSKFWYYQWGNVMLGVHHGHTTRPAGLPQAMAAHQAKMWGDTWFRYYYCGHKHHREMKEYPGVVVEQFRTLAPKDAWHWGNAGFISMRDMQSIHLHKRYGEIGRQICPVEYLERTPNDPTITG